MKPFIIILLIVLVFFLQACNSSSVPPGKRDSIGLFGDSIPVSNGLVGRIFFLPDTTSRLPDFDTMRPLQNLVYLKEVNVPNQSWSLGFPGLHDRFEWFGIEYTGKFTPQKAGDYTFRLVSDDGSQLYIDEKLLIDNDGQHSESSSKADISLTSSQHSIKLKYFQGPRYQVSLQLFWQLVGQQEKIFPGNGFVLIANKPTGQNWLWIFVLLAVLAAAWLLFAKKRKVIA